MNKSESKYFNTAVRMDEAFLEILEKKDFEFITIKEICEKAGVNRSTFYLHYENTGDLLSECIRHMGTSFVEYFDGKNLSDKIQTAKAEELYLITPEYLTPYLNYIRENHRLFQVALEKTNTLGSDGSMKTLTENIFNPIMDKYRVPEKDRKYMIAFYIEGIIAIVKVWLRNGCDDSIEYLVELIQKQVQSPKNNERRDCLTD